MPVDGLPESIGRYRTRELLGIGGFAMVVRAFDDALDGDVAIKVLSPQHAHDPEIRTRFTAEARLLRRVASPHVVQVHDIGELADGRPFIVMEYATGGTLADRVIEGGGVDERALRSTIEALAHGLAALHQAGIVHRDVKPTNLLVTGGNSRAPGEPQATSLDDVIAPFERIVVGDLGFAKDQLATGMGPTMVGGTPYYQAPEQRQVGAEITPSTDVYAATAVLWYCLTGSTPPQHTELAFHLPAVPTRWQPVFERGLAAAPEERYASITEWQAAVLDCAEPSSVGDASRVGFAVSEPAATCPYKGLAAFQPDDAGLFFGRGELVEQLVARVQVASVLVIGGASGSGKSSLLRAGLIPALKRGAIAGSQAWPTALFTPGSRCLDELAHQLGRFCDGARPPSAADLARQPDLARRCLPDDTDVFLAVDQCEEIFTLASESDAVAFLAALEALTQPAHSRVRVAIAMRADFYAKGSLHPWLGRMINANQILVGPMQRVDLREAIERPAQRVGLRLEPGLADTMLDELGADAGALPLLGHALMETWLRRRGNVLTIDGYRHAGGVAGAIANRADETYQALPPEGQTATRLLMLRLVTPGEGAADTRRRVAWTELEATPAVAEVARVLTEARLLTTDGQTVEIAHEALLGSWPRLRGWVDQSRDDLRTRQRIVAAAAEWERSGREPDLLYRGTALATAEEWERTHPGELSGEPARFLVASATAEQDRLSRIEADEQRQRTVRRRAITALASLTVAALVATVAALYGLQESRRDGRIAEEAVTASHAALSRALAAAAEASARDDPLLAMALANEAVAQFSPPHRPGPPTAESRAALVSARVALADPERRITPLTSLRVPEADTVTMSPDGSLVVVGDKSGALSVYDTTSGALAARLAAHDGGIDEAAFDPSGRWLAATGGDGTVSLTDLSDPEAATPETFVDMETSIGWSVAFSPDGERLAVGTELAGIRMYTTADGSPVDLAASTPMVDHLTVGFSGDGELFFAGLGTGFLEVRRSADGELFVEPFAAHPDGNDVWELDLSPDGTKLVTVGAEGTLRVWALPEMELLEVIDPAALPDGPSRMEGAQFLSDDELLVGGSNGRVYLLGPVGGGAGSDVLDVSGIGHGDVVVDAALDDAGTLLATLSDDQTVRLWRIDASFPEPLAVMVEGLGEVTAGDAVPGQESTLLGRADGSVVVVDAAGAVSHSWDTDATITAVGVVDPATMVLGTDDGTVERRTLDGSLLASASPGGGVVDLAVSADRELVATVGSDGAVRVWDGVDLAGHDGRPLDDLQARQVRFAPDGGLVVLGSGLVHFLTLGGESRGDPVPAVDGTAIAVSADGEHFAIGDQAETVRVFATGDREAGPVHELPRHQGGVVDIEFTPDGETLVVLTGRGHVLLWDRATGLALGSPFVPDDGAVALIVGDTGTIRVATGGGELRRLDAFDSELACALTRGVLTEQRTRTFLEDQPLLSCL